MATFTVRPEGIIRQPALTMPGNATGSEAACTSLTASQIRTLLSLGTTSDVTFDIVRATTSVLTPLLKSASGTLGINSDDVNPVTIGSSTDGHYFETGGVPNLRFKSSNVTRTRIGMNGLYLHPGNGIYFSNTLPNAIATSDGCISRSGAGRVAVTTGTNWNDGGAYGTLDVATVDRPTAALTLGNSTYGVTVPGRVSIGRSPQSGVELDVYSASGAVEAQLVSGSSYAELVLASANTGIGCFITCASNLDFFIGGSTRLTLNRSTGAATFSGDISMAKATQGYIRAYGTGGVNNIAMYDDNTNGILSTSSGNLVLSPQGTNYVDMEGCAVIDYGGASGLIEWSVGLYSSGRTAYRNLFNRGDTGSIVSTSGAIYGWATSTSLVYNATNDTGIARNSAGVVEINNGTLVSGGGSYGSLKCAGITASGVVSHGAYTVATLPAAGSNAGKMAQVTDSNVAASGNYGATVAAGGANRVKVFSDGTNWVIA